MRMSDWSSDVCSSDLQRLQGLLRQAAQLAAQDKQAEVSLADGAGDIEVVAGLQRAAVEHSRAGDRAQGGQAERHRARRRGGVAAVERDVVARLTIGRASCRERGCQYV